MILGLLENVTQHIFSLTGMNLDYKHTLVIPIVVIYA